MFHEELFLNRMQLYIYSDFYVDLVDSNLPNRDYMYGIAEYNVVVFNVNHNSRCCWSWETVYLGILFGL